jgi:cytochrome c
MSSVRKLAAAGLVSWLVASTAHAQAATDDPSAARGKRLFLQCASCHANADTTVVKIGPNLKGVFGRPVASQPGYGYSAALKSQSFDWDEAALDRWLTAPNEVAPGTTMAFIGLPNAEDRKAVIAYLRTLR